MVKKTTIEKVTKAIEGIGSTRIAWGPDAQSFYEGMPKRFRAEEALISHRDRYFKASILPHGDKSFPEWFRVEEEFKSPQQLQNQSTCKLDAQIIYNILCDLQGGALSLVFNRCGDSLEITGVGFKIPVTAVSTETLKSLFMEIRIASETIVKRLADGQGDDFWSMGTDEDDDDPDDFWKVTG